MSMNSKKDLIFIFLFAPGKTLKVNEPVPTKTHFQKEIFLVSSRVKALQSDKKYEFVPLWYGPFSKELAIDLSEMIEEGKVSDVDVLSLTSAGYKEASSIWADLQERIQQSIIKIKEQFNRMNIEDLIAYVYKNYPKFTIKSALKKEVVDAYFDKFWDEHNLTEEKLIDAALRVRYS
jgi:uncharacterized protein YwgA